VKTGPRPPFVPKRTFGSLGALPDLLFEVATQAHVLALLDWTSPDPAEGRWVRCSGLGMGRGTYQKLAEISNDEQADQYTEHRSQ
jgi:hypothetical protein